MAVPSFARATASSTLKASPNCGKSKDVATTQGSRTFSGSPGTDRKLKRPSTLTRRARESIAYNADLYHIKPSNPSKPCPLAALPSELRILIYSHTFGDLESPVLMNYGRKRHSPSKLLQICRAIRIEAAYTYFTEASFTWLVKNLDFNAIVKWLESLQSSHRALLSRNRNLTIEVIPGLFNLFTYPPKDFLLDDTLQNHWKACQPFGNLYAVRAMRTNSGTRRSLARFDDPGYDPAHDNAKVFFLLFCRLAVWSRLCTQSIYAGIQWKYTFDLPSDSYGKTSLNNALGEHEAGLRSFLPQLKKLWTRNRCESRIKQPILELFDAFIGAYAKMESQNPIWYQHSGMVVRLKAQREQINCWNRPPPV